MRNVIIGTAGHVDHGKTEIVRALTGRNTDRLEEEKKRGISIVLGFAPLDLGEGIRAGIVDVPGHERFVKNMVSGAVGVDLALIVVAADEGVMPQTIEHFEVLRLLGVEAGVIAITKADIADPEIMEIVESDVRELLKGTPLEDSQIIRTSSVTGEGIAGLKKLLLEKSLEVVVRPGGDYFRMPVDRVFTRPGIGTIVTGTTWRGEVGKGDELVIEPGAKKVRVRDVHNFEEVLGRAGAGTRTALALHGVKTGEVDTGDQIFSPGIAVNSGMIDAHIEISRIKGSRLQNRQRVRFHHAAGEILARVILLDREELGAGEEGLVQLRLERPTVAIGADRFVLRRYSPMRILAGGRILDPVAPKAKRFQEGHITFLNALSGGSPHDLVMAVVERSDGEGVAAGELGIFGLSDEAVGVTVASLIAGGGIISVQDRLISAGVVRKAKERLLDLLDLHNAENPLVWGVDREQARKEAGFGKGPLFEYILRESGDEGVIFFRGGRIRTGSDLIELTGEDTEMLGRLFSSIEKARLRFPSAADLLPLAGDRIVLERYMHILQEEGKVIKLGGDRFVSRAVVGDLLGRLDSIFEKNESLSIGDFKEFFDLSRKYAVPLLEYLDNEGITVRKGDSRVAGPRLGQEKR
ncbi:MAG: selenocysteine-specific translation elongation factor [Candidatus Krumholzibacteriota bacterium]|nr:selenocysteine-specific translation elongation factor [Candidatus Krumholzibacteriota bacterium]